jgi:hypothetical protein
MIHLLVAKIIIVFNTVFCLFWRGGLQVGLMFYG